MKKKMILLSVVLYTCHVFGQGGKVGIDTSSPHQKTVLDIVSKTNNTGVLFPRLTTSNIASIEPSVGDSVVDGLWVYNIDTKCYNYWAAAPQNQWLEICGRPINSVTSGLATLNCTGASSSGTLTSGQPANGVSITIPYTAGNGGAYPAQNISSTGVTGLTASVTAGNFNNGSGNLVFTVAGTPASSGTANFAINMGGNSCSVSVSVNGGKVTLNCGGAKTSGTLVVNSAANGVSFTMPYSVGNGGPYAAQSIASTGVSGLTANIAAGNFNNGTGNLTYTVIGTPTSTGTASFVVNIGGSTCTVNFTVIAGFDLSKLKILSLGASPYSVDTGSNGGLGIAMYSSNNFGPSGTIKTINNWNVTRRNVTSGGLTDLNTAGYKMLIVGYAYDLSSNAEVTAVENFIDNGGVVLWFSETRGQYTVQMINSYAGGSITLGDWSDCTAINTNDGSLVGDFGDARGKIYGNDACIARDIRGGYNTNLIDILSRSVATNNPVAFKHRFSEFYWFGDGGTSVYIGSAPPVNSNSYPWLLDTNKKPVIGQWGSPLKSNVSNSVMMMNIIAKALKNAQ